MFTILTLNLYSGAIKAAYEYEYKYDNLFLTKKTRKCLLKNCVIYNWQAWKIVRGQFTHIEAKTEVIVLGLFVKRCKTSKNIFADDCLIVNRLQTKKKRKLYQVYFLNKCVASSFFNPILVSFSLFLWGFCR